MKKTICSMIAALMATCLCFTGCGQKPEPVSDTVKWINTTYAVLTTANEGDINLIGGYSKNEANKALVLEALEDSWDVTDRKTADEKLNWLLKEGHRSNFKEEIAEIKKLGLLDASKEELKEAASKDKDGNYLLAVIEAYKKYGDHAIDAWDYCRAIQLLGHYYVADLYTKEEALDKSLEIAKTLQKTYPSWNDSMQSYLYGYQYWQEDDATDKSSATAQRREVYEKLKNSKDNPYQIDWKLELKKTW